MRNNTLALLIGIFIVVSLASFALTPKSSIVYITGHAASGSSSTAFNITQEISILVSGEINFGSGRVSANSSSTVIDSALGQYNFSFTNISSNVGAMPPKRFGVMVFDSKRGVFMLYGGTSNLLGGTGEYFDDTWEFNYSSQEWNEISPTANASKRGDNNIVYDSLNNLTIIYGGLVANQSGILGTSPNFETWVYDGSTWTNKTPAVSPQLTFSGMAFDSNRNVSVLFGGLTDVFGASTPGNETWEYDYGANTWTNVSVTSAPPARYSGSMVYYPGNKKTYLFGGKFNESSSFFDVWYYNGSTWTNLTTTGYPVPTLAFIDPDYASRTNPNIAMLPLYDSERDVITVQMFYNYGSQQRKISFWEFSPSNNQWHYIRDLTASEDSYPFIGGADFDSLNNITVYFIGTSNSGGNNAMNETWVYEYSSSGGLANGSWSPYKDYFYIENDGTVNVSVDFSADKNAEQFIGGTNPVFQLKGLETESGSCPALVTSYADIPNATETPGNVCPLLRFGPQTTDEISVAIKLVVPNDIQAGSRTSTITFSASST